MGNDSSNWVLRSIGAIERIEARFDGVAFSPHRHDTYAVGITLGGVQTFDYRGSTRHSLPGQMVILHPDELHDGRSGDDTPFHYRTAYVSPSDIQRAIGGRPLPFIEGGISNDRSLRRVIGELLDDLNRPLDALEYEQSVVDLATALLQAAGTDLPDGTANLAAVQRVRDFIEANIDDALTLSELEQVANYDRWSLSRDFRALLGVSPYRFLIFRRLERACRMISAGSSLVEVALANGFADQSHFTRQFKKAYGMTPRAWAAAHKRSRSV